MVLYGRHNPISLLLKYLYDMLLVSRGQRGLCKACLLSASVGGVQLRDYRLSYMVLLLE